MEKEREPIPQDKHTPTDPVAEELAAVQELDFADRLHYLRVIFEDAYADRGLTMQQAWRKGQLDFTEATPDSPYKHFVLPDIPSPGGDLDTIREAYDSRAVFLEGLSQDFIRVGQGEMWQVPKYEAPLMQAGMSECSTVIADLGDEILVSHISFSEVKPFEAVVEMLDELGVPPEQRYVVASLGYQNPHLPSPRITDEAGYTSQGIPAENITTFHYDFDRDADRQHSGLTQVLVSHDGFYAWSFDLGSQHNGRAGDLPDSDFRGEVAVRFSPQKEVLE